MLTQKDKEFIKEAIREALTVNVQMEKFNLKTGIKESKTDTVYLPEFLVDYLSHVEGALRGQQETLDHVKNRTNETKEGMKAVASIFLGAEKNFKQLSNYMEFQKNRQIEEKIKERITEGEIV